MCSLITACVSLGHFKLCTSKKKVTRGAEPTPLHLRQPPGPGHHDALVAKPWIRYIQPSCYQIAEHQTTRRMVSDVLAWERSRGWQHRAPGRHAPKADDFIYESLAMLSSQSDRKIVSVLSVGHPDEGRRAFPTCRFPDRPQNFV